MSTSSGKIPAQPPKNLFESDSDGSEDEPQKDDGSEYEPSGSEDNDNDDGTGTEGAGTDNDDGTGTEGGGTDNDEDTETRDQSDNIPETETEEEEMEEDKEEPEPEITEEEMLSVIRELRESLDGMKTGLVKFTDDAVGGLVGEHNHRMDNFISGLDEDDEDEEDLSQAMDRISARNVGLRIATGSVGSLGIAGSIGSGGSVGGGSGGIGGGYSPQVPSTSSGILVASGGSNSNVSGMSTPTYSSHDEQNYDPFVPPSQPSSAMSPFKKNTTPKKGGTPKKDAVVVTPKKEVLSPEKEVVTQKKEPVTPKKDLSTPKKGSATPKKVTPKKATPNKKNTPKKSPKKAAPAPESNELITDIKVEVKDEPKEDDTVKIVLNDGTVCNIKMDNVCNCPLDHTTTPTRATRSARKAAK